MLDRITAAALGLATLFVLVVGFTAMPDALAAHRLSAFELAAFGAFAVFAVWRVLPLAVSGALHGKASE